MGNKRLASPKSLGSKESKSRLDRTVTEARKERENREQGYREQSLKIHPWVCGRCGREFTRENLHELTVHHKDHNHDNNPPDGSNWENLCVYCHDNEHQRYLDQIESGENSNIQKQGEAATHKPFADLKEMMQEKK